MARAQARKKLRTSHINTYLSSHMNHTKCKVQETVIYLSGGNVKFKKHINMCIPSDSRNTLTC